MLKTLLAITLTITLITANANTFTLNVEDETGQINANCGTEAIISPYNYLHSDDCEIVLEREIDGDLIKLPLGTCPNNRKLSIIIDNHRYKFNVDGTFYKDLIAQEDIISLPAPLTGCSGNSQPNYEFSLYTETEIVPLDADFGAVWGVTDNNSPIVILKSLSGNTVCNGGQSVELTNLSDTIFSNSFE